MDCQLIWLGLHALSDASVHQWITDHEVLIITITSGHTLLTDTTAQARRAR